MCHSSFLWISRSKRLNFDQITSLKFNVFHSKNDLSRKYNENILAWWHICTILKYYALLKSHYLIDIYSGQEIYNGYFVRAFFYNGFTWRHFSRIILYSPFTRKRQFKSSSLPRLYFISHIFRSFCSFVMLNYKIDSLFMDDHRISNQHTYCII